jgi:UDP-glucose 4-epimerase
LVTGGAGFIGSHFVDKLIAEGYNVRILDNLSAGKIENITGHLKDNKAELIVGDIRDSALVTKCLDGVSTVVHFAAQTSVTFSVEHPDLTFDINASGTKNLLSACAKQAVGKFVFASTCAVYGDPTCLPINETCKTHPISPYAESKLSAENFCFEFDKKKLLQSVVLRFFNVYGLRQCLNDYSGVITRFIDLIKQKKALTIYGDGQQSRDFVNVQDIVGGVFAAMQNEAAHGQIFNIGSGKATTINELAKEISELAGVKSIIKHEKERTGEIKHSFADISKAKKVLDYRPSINLHDGLKELISAV